MDRIEPFDAVNNTVVFGSNANWQNANPNGGLSGSIPPEESFRHPQEEIVNAIVQAGLTPDKNDLTQLWQALQSLITNHINIPQTSAWTGLAALSDIPLLSTEYVAQSLTLTGTRYIDAFSSVSFHNKDPANGVCNCVSWIRLDNAVHIDHTGTAVDYQEQVPCAYRRLYTGLDPAQTYTVDLVVQKGNIPSPIEVNDALLVLIHE